MKASEENKPVNAATFDTLQAVRNLKAAGLVEEQAEAIAHELREAATADRNALATKGDIEHLGTRTDALEARMDAKFNAVHHKLNILQWAVGVQSAFTLAIFAMLLAKAI